MKARLFLASLCTISLWATEPVALTPTTVQIIQDVLGEPSANALTPVAHLSVAITNNTSSPIKALLVNWKHEVDGSVVSHSAGDEVFGDSRSSIVEPGETVIVTPLMVGRRSNPPLGDWSKPFASLGLEKVLSTEVDVAIFADGTSYGPDETGFVEQLFGRARAAQAILTHLEDGGNLTTLSALPTAEFDRKSVTSWERQWRRVLARTAPAQLQLIKRPAFPEPPEIKTKWNPLVKAGGSKDKIVYGVVPCMTRATPHYYNQATGQWSEAPNSQIFWTDTDPWAFRCSARRIGDGALEFIAEAPANSIDRASSGVGPYSQTPVPCTAGSKIKSLRMHSLVKTSSVSCSDMRVQQVNMTPFVEDTGLWAEVKITASSTCGTPILEASGYRMCDGSSQFINSGVSAPCGGGGTFQVSVY